jgi:hypothetical protein
MTPPSPRSRASVRPEPRDGRAMLTDERARDDHATASASRHGPAVWQVVALVVALCFLTGVVGWWLNEPEDETFGTVDVGFLSDMETHHNGAIALGFAYLGREHDPLVGHFARPAPPGPRRTTCSHTS